MSGHNTKPISCTVENLARLIHKEYCMYCLEIKGSDYWTGGDYNKLDDVAKEADRYIARFFISLLGPEYLMALEQKLEVLSKFSDRNK